MNWPQMHVDWPELEEDRLGVRRGTGNRGDLARLLQHHRALGPDQVEKEILAFEDEARFPGEVK